jgi:hypothetical protein
MVFKAHGLLMRNYFYHSALLEDVASSFAIAFERNVHRLNIFEVF